MVRTATIDFGKERIGPLFRAIFFPTLIGMVFNSVLTIIDGIFVGQGVGYNGIAAVNIVAPLFMLTIGVGLMLGIGASVVAGIELSAEKSKKASVRMTQAFLAGTLSIAVVIIVAMIWPSQVVHWLGSNDTLELNAKAYMLPLMPGMLFLLFQCVGMMLIRLDGSPRYAMWCQAIPATINIVLDYIMVFPMKMGVAGAAWATSISCAIGGIMVLAYFLFYSNKLKFTLSKNSDGNEDIRFFYSVGYMSKIGFATFIGETAFGLMMLAGNYAFMAIDGEVGVAAYSVACYLFPVVFSIANAVAQSAQPIISFNYGLSNQNRVMSTLKVALLTAVISGAIVTLFISGGNELIVSAFINPAERAFNLASKGLPLFSTCAVFFAINVTFIGFYQSIERAFISIFYTLLRGVVLMLLFFAWLPCLIGIDGLWLAIPASECVTMLIILIVFAAGDKRFVTDKQNR